MVLLGESVKGFSAPVVPLPLDGQFFLETVKEAIRGGPPDDIVVLDSVEPRALLAAMPAPVPITELVPPAPPRLGRMGLRIEALDAALEEALPAKARVGVEELGRAAWRLAQTALTGRWELRARETLRTLFFKEGALVFASSTLASESLLERALRDGLVELTQVRELRLLRTSSELEVLQALMERGYVRETEAIPLLQRFTEQIALEALSEADTAFRWSLGAEPDWKERPLSVRPLRALALEALRRGLTADSVGTRTRGIGAIPRWLKAPEISKAGWTEREARLLTAVDGATSIQTLLVATGVRQDVGLRALAVAEALGFLEIQAPAFGAVSPVSAELDVQRLEAKWDSSQEADYFEVLGLPRTAGSEEVARAYQALSEEFHPLRYVGHSDVSLQSRAQKLRDVFTEAASSLADDRLRTLYARNLPD